VRAEFRGRAVGLFLRSAAEGDRGAFVEEALDDAAADAASAAGDRGKFTGERFHVDKIAREKRIGRRWTQINANKKTAHVLEWV